MNNSEPNLVWLKNDFLELNEGMTYHPAFIVTKDLRMMPIVTGLPFDNQTKEVSWDLHKEGYFGIYIREDVFPLLKDEKEFTMVNAILASGILSQPKDQAKRLMSDLLGEG